MKITFSVLFILVTAVGCASAPPASNSRTVASDPKIDFGGKAWKQVWRVVQESRFRSYICNPVLNYGDGENGQARGSDGHGCIAGNTDLGATVKVDPDQLLELLVKGFASHGYGDLRNSKLANHLRACEPLSVACAIEGVEKFPPK